MMLVRGSAEIGAHSPIDVVLLVAAMRFGQGVEGVEDSRGKELGGARGAPRVRRRGSVGVLALRAAGARLPKRWPSASAVRRRERETWFERELLSALGVAVTRGEETRAEETRAEETRAEVTRAEETRRTSGTRRGTRGA